MCKKSEAAEHCVRADVFCATLDSTKGPDDDVRFDVLVWFDLD